jgi:hypothetical protein
MKKTIIFLVLLSIITLFFGCERELDVQNPVPRDTKGVYVINEGNFGRGNAEITLYIPDSNKVVQDLFYNVNSMRLGDQAQNMYINNGVGYIVVSGSNKIVLMDINTNKLIDTIASRLDNPRSIVFANNRMYVSNFYGSSISIFGGADYKTFIRNVAVEAYPDEMIISNDKVYITHQTFSGISKTVTVFDLYFEQVTKTVEVGCNPCMLKRYGNHVVVLCSGDYGNYNDPYDDIFAELYFINSSGDNITDMIHIGEHPMDFVIAGDHAYITGDAGIKKVDLKEKKVIDDSFIPGMFYSIGYEPVNNLLYLGDAKNYSTNGEVFVYGLNADLRNKFTVGIIPGAFCFNID